MGELKNNLESVKINDSIINQLNIDNDSIQEIITNDKELNHKRYKNMKDFLFFLNLRSICLSIEQLYVLVMSVEKHWGCTINDLWTFTTTDNLGMMYNEYYRLEKEALC